MRKHPQSPMPHIVRGGWSVTGTHDAGSVIYTTNLIAGVAPIHFWPDCVNTIIRVWFVFDTAESGAGETSYTDIDFRVGDIGTYTSVATLDTKSNPGAGVAVWKQVYHQVAPGDTLFAYPTRTGGGSTNFETAGLTFGFDFIGERIA